MLYKYDLAIIIMDFYYQNTSTGAIKFDLGLKMAAIKPMFLQYTVKYMKGDINKAYKEFSTSISISICWIYKVGKLIENLRKLNAIGR